MTPNTDLTQKQKTDTLQKNNLNWYCKALWNGDEVREIRAFDTYGVYYTYVNSPEMAIQLITPHINTKTIYITLNPCQKSLFARHANEHLKKCSRADKTTSDNEIETIKYMLVDIDPKRPKNISSSADEYAEAYEVASQIQDNVGLPYIFGCSGNGFHLIYRLQDRTSKEQIKHYLGILGQNHNTQKIEVDQKVYNPARITKVMGTWAKKGSNTKDRPHRMAQVIAINRNSKELTLPDPPPEQKQKTYSTDSVGTFDSRAYVEKIIQINNLELMPNQPKDKNGNLFFCLKECIVDRQHSPNESAIFITPEGKICYQCFHQSCQDITWNDIKQRLKMPESKKRTKTCNRCGMEILWNTDFDCYYNLNGEKHRCGSSTKVEKKSTKVESIADIPDEEQEPDAPEKKNNIDIDLDRIHPLFKEYWSNFENRTETCKEYLLTSLLVSLATMLGNRTMLKIERGIRPNIYALLLGDSTFHRKTTGMDLGAECLVKLSEKYHHEYEEEKLKYDVEIKKYNDLPKEQQQHYSEPIEPKDRTIVYSAEITPEMLLKKMSDRPDGIFMYSEFGNLLSRLTSSYMHGFKERLTDFFDGRSTPYRRETKSGGCTTIENPAPSLLACSTFQWIQDHAKDSDLLSGFLGRFVFVARYEYSDTKIPIGQFHTASPKWINYLEQLEQFSQELMISHDAIESYSAWYEYFRDLAINESKFLHSFLGRLLTTCHKIAIINHAIECTLDPDKNKTELNAVSYDYAYPWIDFFAQNIKLCFEELTSGPDLKEMKILDIIKRKGKDGIISKTKLAKYSHMSAKDLADYMDTLREKNYVVKCTKGRYEYWKINNDDG